MDFRTELAKWGYNKGNSVDVETLIDEILPSLFSKQERMYSKEEMVATFHYGHQIGMNSILSIQSQHSPKQLESPDLESLKEEWFEQFKKK